MRGCESIPQCLVVIVDDCEQPLNDPGLVTRLYVTDKIRNLPEFSVPGTDLSGQSTLMVPNVPILVRLFTVC